VLEESARLVDHCTDSTEARRQLLIDFRLAAHPTPVVQRTPNARSTSGRTALCVRLIAPLARDKVRIDLVVEPGLPVIAAPAAVSSRPDQHPGQRHQAAQVREGFAGLVEAPSVARGEEQRDASPSTTTAPDRRRGQKATHLRAFAPRRPTVASTRPAKPSPHPALPWMALHQDVGQGLLETAAVPAMTGSPGSTPGRLRTLSRASGAIKRTQERSASPTLTAALGVRCTTGVGCAGEPEVDEQLPGALGGIGAVIDEPAQILEHIAKDGTVVADEAREVLDALAASRRLP